ncbi:MAG: hypothetical protein GWN00_39090, partial [Aliifodinibius sp.]|nr:hypothetical protein [Fodinibius sp.]NIY30572.1 hypothetical protein [Fodinibius sp.]
MTGMTGDTIAAPYDKFDGKPMLVGVGGLITVAATNASAAAISGTYFRIPFACKLVGACFAEETGGTAAGPTVHLDRSVGGTGTYGAIGTA